MQFYSFDTGDPVFDIGGWKLSFQIITLENIYGLSPDHTTVNNEGARWRLDCSMLAWGGGQQRAPGSVTVEARLDDNQLRLKVSATAGQKITAVKILARD